MAGASNVDIDIDVENDEDALEGIVTEGESNYLDMSDEDFLNQDEPTLAQDAPATTTPTDEEEEGEEEEDSSEEAEAEPDVAKEEGKEEGASEATDKEVPAVDKDKVAATEKAKVESTAEDTAAVDYKAMYEKLTAPFKANGRDMQVSNVDEAIHLMQMGANYNKKMAGLKPSLKILKMLENEGLLDESKLTYLIDLDKKNPQAVQKFIRESGVDPLTIDPEQKIEYTPSSQYAVGDQQIELDEVLSNIKDTPSYARTIHAVTNQMDEPSKRLLLSQPRSIALINEHMSNGIYDRIMAQVEKDRVFGQLAGLSDIEAYQKVGDALHKAGAFNDVVNPTTTHKEPVVVATTVPASQTDNKLKDKKRAASPTKATVAAKAPLPADFNPLNMSDAEFEKFAATLN